MKSRRNRKQLLVAIYTMLLLMFSISFVHAQSANEIYQSAGQHYKQKDFAQAAAEYEKLLRQGYKTSEIYYNLGNCYYKLDSVAKCILNLERAHALAPDDEDVKHNLQLASLKTIDKIEAVPQLSIITWWNNFVSHFSSKTWGLFSLITLWIAFLAAAIALFTSYRRAAFLPAFLLFVLSIFFLSLGVIQRGNESNSKTAILIASSTNVKSAPDENANNLFLLHEGARLQLLDRVGEWNKIRLTDGKVGWVEESTFEKI